MSPKSCAARARGRVETELSALRSLAGHPNVVCLYGAFEDAEQVYVVQAGDGLSAIAGKYDLSMQVICDYNGWERCGADHTIFPGDEIRIPPNVLVPAAEAPADVIAAGEPAAPAAIGCQHTVVPGDNQGRVANQYDVTLDELAAANLNNPVWNTFLIGSQIAIPANGSC